MKTALAIAGVVSLAGISYLTTFLVIPVAVLCAMVGYSRGYRDGLNEVDGHVQRTRPI